LGPLTKVACDIFASPSRASDFSRGSSSSQVSHFHLGAHLCLGQYLAKMEMRILFEELLPRLKSLALDGEAKMSQATFVNGPKALPIRFELN